MRAVLDRACKPSNAATFKVKIDKGGYDFVITADLSKAGVCKGEAFLPSKPTILGR